MVIFVNSSYTTYIVLKINLVFPLRLVIVHIKFITTILNISNLKGVNLYLIDDEVL